jgi:hypothetical protein
MNGLNPEVSRRRPHQAHRVPAMTTTACTTKVQHRKRRSERLAYEEVIWIEDLELLELRYQALRARMTLEELFSDGFTR